MRRVGFPFPPIAVTITEGGGGFSNRAASYYLRGIAHCFLFPAGLSQRMAAAAGPRLGAEELGLLEKSLGLAKGNKYGAQGERKVKGARGGREHLSGPRPHAQPPRGEGGATASSVVAQLYGYSYRRLEIRLCPLIPV